VQFAKIDKILPKEFDISKTPLLYPEISNIQKTGENTIKFALTINPNYYTFIRYLLNHEKYIYKIFDHMLHKLTEIYNKRYNPNQLAKMELVNFTEDKANIIIYFA
jgi:hypothetical protein